MMNNSRIPAKKSRKLINFFSLGILICIGWGILVSCFEQPTTPLLVGVNNWPGFAPLYLAEQLGYYQNSSIDIVDYPSTTEISRGMRSGNLQGGGITIDETLILAETFPEVRVIMLIDVSNGADVILGKPELKTLADIKGKKVGVENTALGAYMLSRGLDKAGLSLQDITVVSLDYSEHEAAFKQGEVDAVVTFEPVRSNLLATGAKVLFDSSKIPGEVVDMLVVRQDILETRSKDLEKLVRGWFMALDYLKKEPENAAKIMAKRGGITAKEFLSSLQLLRFFTPIENQKLLSQTDLSLVNSANKLSKLMREKEILQSNIDFSSLLDPRFFTQLN
ncbi:MAG: ABC transporter substrate-binding protein [Planktothrix sp. GU0601_MAG3]|nr:MAG: ABC transporter substrate-binding protein [Planktothrix sp. GU0601_MAG3]